ncbi:plasmid replication protein RepC [Tropicibacter naphthalenivorans]|uniref:Replication initiation protein RepC n=1 Tax=Tropicibacter naphthalenivorans TaxID=441103 RepID=A0A0P1H275_9RHOB|nr:plasmid replication protein RepC [Tropicibacter naphthalenivorans]CUH82501.1 replication initiation protein RepC [Tropicibacter naphthalenivorans]SMD06937.1 replication initiation protein RepC [Tropicibacter naphthalenivorans]
MQKTSRIDVGRPQTAVPYGLDKWALLQALTDASEHFGLTHRALTVLKALLTFHPDRHIEAGVIVFPSNRTLCDRLNGMPDSTLRRHLKRLVDCGIVRRHASPNGKRYARRVAGGVEIAFGFDLTPMVERASEAAEASRAARELAEQKHVLRDRLNGLRHRLIELGETFAEACDHLRLALRRKLSLPELQQLERDVENLLKTVSESQEMSAPDVQNERHIDNKNKLAFDSETAATPTPVKKTNPNVPLSEFVQACHETRSLFAEPIQQEADLVGIASRLAPMLGIDGPVWDEAKRHMGALVATLSVLCIHERLAHIQSPGAYLRRLAQNARCGNFDIMPMVNSVLSAGKSRNCQLTI